MNRHAKAPSAFTHGRVFAGCVVAICAVTLLTLASVAGAAPKRGAFFIGSTSANPALGGTFNSPRDIAVSTATGHVGQIYVVDDNNHRIQRFAANGTFEWAIGRDVIAATKAGDLGDAFEKCTVAADCKAGSFGTTADGPAGEFDNPQGIAIDQDTGSFYVTDRDNRRIQQFDADGNFIRMWGFDVIAAAGPPPNSNGTGFEICDTTKGNLASDCKNGVGGIGVGQFSTGTTTNGYRPYVSPPDGSPATGSVYLANTGNRRIEVYGTDGSSPSTLGTTTEFASGFPLYVAVDANGIVYANSGTSSATSIQRYNPAVLGFQSPIGAPPLTNTSGGVNGLETSGGHLWASSGNNPLSAIRDFDLTANPASVTEANVVDIHASGFGLTSQGIGLDPLSGRLYYSTTTTSHRVLVLDDIGAPPMAMVATPPTEVTGHSARLAGEITPNGPAGIPTQYRLEYSVNGLTWTPVASEINIGDGTTPIAVSQMITGLLANTFYRARIVASKAFGNPTVTSSEASFITDAIAPEVQTVYPIGFTETTARLTGFVNANNLPTTYYFQYGKTTSYEMGEAPVPEGDTAGSVSKQVTADIDGLFRGQTYHYRIVATNEEGTTLGNDVIFSTRGDTNGPAGDSPPPPRAYEMVTPPFKATRSVVKVGAPVHENPRTVQPSLSGDSVFWENGFTFFPLTEEVAAPGSGDYRVIRRTPQGWVNQTLNTLRIDPTISSGQVGVQFQLGAQSGDLESLTWKNALGQLGAFLPNEGSNPNLLYTRREGTGIKGWTGWLTNVDTQIVGEGFPVTSQYETDGALFNDDGTVLIRWGGYRGLDEDPDTVISEDPSDDQQLDGGAGGRTLYTQRVENADELPATRKELVNECTGAVVDEDATQVPMRNGNGTLGGIFESGDDYIDTRPCEDGNVVSKRGAAGGGGGGDAGPTATAVSNDGSRIFFSSPDPASGAPSSCVGPGLSGPGDEGTGAKTDCPPQLYVRQYDENNENPVVRWISKAQGIGQQLIGEMGAGAFFQGASRDGRYVYFKTNSPLTPDDPNGGQSITAGSASANSWDLYRYELPQSLNADPAAGTLERITAGPSGSADPNTEASGFQTSSALRYHSDDGRRVYFMTKGQIAGADTSPPTGGTTVPGGTAASDGGQRNVYLYDDTGTSPEWKFVARLPRSNGGSSQGDLNQCATKGVVIGSAFNIDAQGDLITQAHNCWRGTPDGSAVVFFTGAQLTADDDDQAGDVYLYDLKRDELTRVSASPPGIDPYDCAHPDPPTALAYCNGDLGWNSSTESARGWGGNRQLNIFKDANGVLTVLFQSRSALAEEDKGISSWDVYQWRDGEVSLVSPGDAEHDAFFSGNSVDGRDIFFVTSQPLDPREIDDSDYDTYDARVGGGFPYVPPPDPCDVLTFQCESEATAAPAPRSAASVAMSGTGNLSGDAAAKPRKCGKGKVRRKGRCVAKLKTNKRKKAAKGAKRGQTSNERRAGR